MKLLMMGHLLGDFYFQTNKVAEKYLIGTLLSTFMALLCIMMCECNSVLIG